MTNLKILNSKEDLATEAASYVVDLSHKCIDQNGNFTVALAGGSTPKRLYELLAEENLDWSKWDIFWSDERIVPIDDERSNYKLAFDAWLNQVPPKQLHPISRDTGSDYQAIAAAYEAEIRTTFDCAPPEVPKFDLILLGIGSDGHTASLFPGKPALEEKEKLVVASPPGILPPPVKRVTFTYPLINAAKNVVFLVSGADKAEALKQLRQPDSRLPAAMVNPTGNLHWLVDRAAAGQ